ncbi:hypothetical protein ACFTZI_08215 [Streptomyces decoyicus]|uniref:hypothetical protein n=1 Tax=Streptomyces decoyicus TaxID=249567 RepID=UPI00363A8E0E
MAGGRDRRVDDFQGAIGQLFTRPGPARPGPARPGPARPGPARLGQAARTTTAFGVAAFAAFGLSLGAAVQTGYERVRELSPARRYARWRHVLWLVVLVGYLFMSATTTLWRQSSALTAAALLSAVLFFWWSQRMLLGGRVGWGALLPGAHALGGAGECAAFRQVAEGEAGGVSATVWTSARWAPPGAGRLRRAGPRRCRTGTW